MYILNLFVYLFFCLLYYVLTSLYLPLFAIFYSI